MTRHSKNNIKVNKIIGQRILEARLGRGLSRQQLASRVNVAHQQIRKYELGVNHVSASKLFSIASALERGVDYFFDDKIGETEDQHRRMCLEVSRNFLKINNPKHQAAVNNMVKVLAAS